MHQRCAPVLTPRTVDHQIVHKVPKQKRPRRGLERDAHPPGDSVVHLERVAIAVAQAERVRAALPPHVELRQELAHHSARLAQFGRLLVHDLADGVPGRAAADEDVEEGLTSRRVKEARTAINTAVEERGILKRQRVAHAAAEAAPNVRLGKVGVDHAERARHVLDGARPPADGKGARHDVVGLLDHPGQGVEDGGLVGRRRRLGVVLRADVRVWVAVVGPVVGDGGAE